MPFFPEKLKSLLIKELELFFGNDKKRVNHAKKVLEFSEKLLIDEGGNSRIIIPTAILHDVGIKIAEEKFGSSAPPLQEKEGPPVARRILSNYEFTKDEIDKICEIISHHHSKKFLRSLEGKIIFDADWLVNFGNESKVKDKQKVEKIIDRLYFTNSAKIIAKYLYL